LNKLFLKITFIVSVISFLSQYSYASSDSSSAKDEPPQTGVIFTLDGGGVRGVLQLYLLAALEEKLGEPLVNKVDLWGGTSVGGISVLALNKPRKDDPYTPQYRPKDLIKLYTTKGSKIFEKGYWQSIKSGWGFWGPRYSPSGIESVAKEYLGDTWLSQSIGKVIVSGFDTARYVPAFFKSESAKEKPDQEFLMRDVARLTSAAQTYFPPARITSKSGRVVEGIDGGNIANNITASALVEARKRLPAKDWLIVNFGTGKVSKTMDYKKAKGKGALFWVQPTISITMDGVSEVVHYQLNELFPPVKCDNDFYKQRYYRFQPVLPEKNSGLDDASPSNMRELCMIAERMVMEHDHELDAIADELRRRPSIHKPKVSSVPRLLTLKAEVDERDDFKEDGYEPIRGSDDERTPLLSVSSPSSYSTFVDEASLPLLRSPSVKQEKLEFKEERSDQESTKASAKIVPLHVVSPEASPETTREEPLKVKIKTIKIKEKEKDELL
jgi:hypothetical protein